MKKILAGKVVRHLGRGKKLGYPTANLDVNLYANLHVEDGIYLGLAMDLPALVFIGAAETFGEQEKKIEVYILDFNKELYGQKLEVEVIKKIRDNQKFDTKEELIEQMKQDELVARQFFTSYNKDN